MTEDEMILKKLLLGLTDFSNGACTNGGSSSFPYDLSSMNLLFQFIIRYTSIVKILVGKII